jgi:ABC-type glycerol-3-phosphate transport system substrate-binding protein
VSWKADLARDLAATKLSPDLVIGRYLRSSLVRDRFRSLDYLFGELALDQTAFYPGLLAVGKVGGQQLLLPLSFNLPAIIFRKDGETKLSDQETIGLEELATAASAFNRKQGTAWSRIGFSPRWDADFLVLAVDAAGAAFREGKPLEWSEQGLRAAIDRLRRWGSPDDPSQTVAEDFQFKYLFTPAYSWITEGRALFAYQSSDQLFLVPEDKLVLLDFRWFTELGAIPLLEDLVCVGIPRSGKDEQAAEAFIAWLFKVSRQQSMLEASRRTRALESSFGIAGGFSSLSEVTEKMFPLYYSAIKGHIPPASELGTPNVLPVEWPELKVEVLGSWLRDKTAGQIPAGEEEAAQAGYGAEISTKIADYQKSGRALR